MQTVVDLLSEMIAIDSQRSVSNVPIANFMQSQLEHWEIERIDYVDREGIAKTNIVAADPESASPLAFAGHLDTVSATGWDTDPFRPTIAQDRLTGLGATDMKGPIAAFLSAARQMDPRVRPKIVLTADEEVTKQGVREVVPEAGDPVTTEGCVWHGHGPSQRSVATECPFARGKTFQNVCH